MPDKPEGLIYALELCVHDLGTAETFYTRQQAEIFLKECRSVAERELKKYRELNPEPRTENPSESSEEKK